MADYQKNLSQEKNELVVPPSALILDRDTQIVSDKRYDWVIARDHAGICAAA
jgi:hypothetical protein